MPLSAIIDGKKMLAFQVADATWVAMSDLSREGRVTTPCCACRAVAKVSSLGLRFFSHFRRGICRAAAESLEHLQAKEIIAKAAIASGWSVETEARGATPVGEEWIADVLASKSTVRVAFEVQLSTQTEADTLRRQRRYKLSKVRGCWLLRASIKKRSFEIRTFHHNENSPAFELVCGPELSRFTVPGFGVDLGSFVESSLAGRLEFKPDTEVPVPPEVSVAYFWLWGRKDLCPACHAWVRILGHTTGSHDPERDHPEPVDVRREILALVEPGTRLDYGIELIPPAQAEGDFFGRGYNQLCPKCGATLTTAHGSGGILKSPSMSRHVNRAPENLITRVELRSECPRPNRVEPRHWSLDERPYDYDWRARANHGAESADDYVTAAVAPVEG